MMKHNGIRSVPVMRVGLLLAALTIAGCGYGEVTPRGYEHATALYAICNRRDTARLEAYAELVESEALLGEISQQEAGWIRAIVAQAQAGDWQTASRDVRQLMEDQVEER